MDKKDVTIKALYDLSHTMAAGLFIKYEYPWEVLQNIRDFILETGKGLPSACYKKTGDNIWIHETAIVADSASLKGPLIICEGAEIRHCAFIRGDVLVGSHAVVGNSCEIKNSILFDYVQAPHYNYLGDSVLGYKSHMGAASLTSNLKSDKKPVMVHTDEGDIETGLKKFGAMVGDMVEVGCGSVLNPGCVIGSHSSIYPLSSVRGCVPAGSIYKKAGEIVAML